MNKPPANSVWRNIKKGTLYRVWTTALSSTQTRVIYQESAIAIPDKSLYTVADSEIEGRLGTVYLRTVYQGLSWTLNWHDIPIIVDGKPVVAIAWARPLELWHEKFQRIEF